MLEWNNHLVTPWWLSYNLRKEHPCYYASPIISEGTSIDNWESQSCYPFTTSPPPLYNVLLWKSQTEKVPIQTLVLKKILEMTIETMCTSPGWYSRFLIAIITTSIVQCLWVTDNTLGVMKSLNSRLSNLPLMSEMPWPVLACPLEWKTQEDTSYFLNQSPGDLGKLS